MTITEKVAYLKGLADGLDLDKDPSKEGKLISKIIDILEDIGLAVEDLEEEVEAIDEELEAMSEDLADVEDMIFEDYDDEDDDEDDDDEEFDFADLGDDFFEIECPECGEDLVIDESIFDVGEIGCPNCGNKFALDLVDEEEEDED
ncbi:MAG: hypothetical protein IKU62_05880 [Ruminiclostridium sp.]|nr:hypothetical protein [Ruminiclostridium sp.]